MTIPYGGLPLPPGTLSAGQAEEKARVAAAALAPDMSVYTIPVETEVVVLEATEAFAMLTAKEQAYAEALGRADWEGAKICLLQCSSESVPIFALLQLVFSAQAVPELVAAAKEKGITEEEVKQTLIYCAAFYGNLGNYKSFGDTKFVPGLPADRFQLFMKAGKADAGKVAELLFECCDLPSGNRMYSLPARQRQLGLGPTKGVSTYFSANCDEEDAEISSLFMDSIKLSPYNTRLFKNEDGSYTILLASSETAAGDDPVGKLCISHKFTAGDGDEPVEGAPPVEKGEEKTFTVRRGDYAPLMARVVAALKDALPHVANDNQKAMTERYIASFTMGSIEEHREASRHWIKDLGPSVESYIGFIESYRDPSGLRGEWEGFVSCVNKDVSKKFQALVDKAEDFLLLMPWPKVFEKETFIRPDFTSLEVLSFGSSGVPAGINIPNYDDIRENEGFKNVSLGNVLKAGYGAGEKPVTFVADADQAIFKKLKGEAFEVQVGIHELLGHGSGRLFNKENRGTDKDTIHQVEGTPHPLAGYEKFPDLVKGPYYIEGTTWDSTFGRLASSYEECRAESVGLYLCLEPQVLEVFGHTDAADVVKAGGIHDITYTNWLLMVKAGLGGLEFYTPETDAWRQAHMNARYVILKVLMEAGQGLVTLTKKTGADGNPDIEVTICREKIATIGKEAIGTFLVRLQVMKSLGEVDGAVKMFGGYSEVDKEMLEIRKIVMARKEPRKVLVQGHMQKKAGGGGLELKAFDSSPEGMINSFVARFPAEDPELLALYHSDKPHVVDSYTTMD